MISVKPLNFVNVNSFKYAERLDLVQGNASTCYVQLVQIDDAILAPQGGQFSTSQTVQVTSRYLPAAGATVQIVFPRTLSIQPTPANQDVTVAATVVDSRDGSILRFDLTASNTDKIISEGIKLVITESGVSKTYPIDHFVRRRTNVPGA